MKYAYCALSLFDPRLGVFSDNVTILTDDGIVSDVISNCKSVPASYKKLNLKGKYAIPGLINLSSHLFGSGKDTKGLLPASLQKAVIGTFSASMAKSIPDKAALENLRNALYSGVTTVRVIGDPDYSDVRVRNMIRSGKEQGPRVIASGPAITCLGGYGEQLFSVCSNDPKELSIHVDGHAAIDTDFIKICVDKKLSPTRVSPMTSAQIRAVCDRAHLLGYKVSAHCESKDAVMRSLECGADVIEGGAPIDSEALGLFKRTGAALIVSLSPTLALARISQNITKLDDTLLSRARELIKTEVRSAREALSSGIPIGIGSGASLPFVTHYSLYRELHFFSKYCKVSIGTALSTATLKNAEIAGISSVTGSVEKGKSADMVILSSDPTKNLTALSAPIAVVSRGELIQKPSPKRIPEVDRLADLLM